MSIAIKELMRFQLDRGLHKQPYNPSNEHVNIIEELLESVGYDVSKENRGQLAKYYDLFVKNLILNETAIPLDGNSFGTWEQADAYADIIVFSVGALTKLGYDPEKVLLEVGKEINSRTGVMKNGKFEKDLSHEAKDKWYKASFAHCGLEKSKKLQRRRRAFFAAEGYEGSESEIKKWLEDLT